MSPQTIRVNRDIQKEQKERAANLREHLSRQGTLVINLVSSPGAGKTALLEATAKHLRGKHRIAVLAGDLATDRDAQRLEPFVPVRQLTTGGACHLEIDLVQRGLDQLPNEQYDFLFIENVGNLVCPASHDLAEHVRVVLLSTTEGDDKPAKYPKMFRTSELLIITKSDLLPHVPFSIPNAISDAKQVRDGIETLTVGALQGEGIAEWCEWLRNKRQEIVSTTA
jgi:hydrogenase nickel incorporation protein HypB